jgi:hypothetical protein
MFLLYAGTALIGLPALLLFPAFLPHVLTWIMCRRRIKGSVGAAALTLKWPGGCARPPRTREGRPRPRPHPAPARARIPPSAPDLARGAAAGFVTLEVSDVKLTNPRGFEHKDMVTRAPAPRCSCVALAPPPPAPLRAPWRAALRVTVSFPVQVGLKMARATINVWSLFTKSIKLGTIELQVSPCLAAREASACPAGDQPCVCMYARMYACVCVWMCLCMFMRACVRAGFSETRASELVFQTHGCRMSM